MAGCGRRGLGSPPAAAACCLFEERWSPWRRFLAVAVVMAMAVVSGLGFAAFALDFARRRNSSLQKEFF